MKMTLTINVSVEGKDAEELLETLLALKKDPLEPIDTTPGTVGHEFTTNGFLKLDLQDNSREGGIAFRIIYYHVGQEYGEWLKDMSWNTFLLELKIPDGGKIRHLQGIGPVAIQALRDVFLPPRIQNDGDDT